MFPEALMAQLEEDPYNFDADTSFEDEQMQLFIEANKNSEINMAVVMHMVDALGYFSNKSKESAKKAGFEIAELGRHGIDPHKKDTYSLSTVPGKTFTGWKLYLAFFKKKNHVL